MDNDTSTETALRRHEIIAPLLVPGLEKPKSAASGGRYLNGKVYPRGHLVRRYLASYQKGRYDGLKPKTRSDTGKLKAIPQEILDRAELKQELPERSVRRIIRILEGEGIVRKGETSRSTLSRHLLKMGLGTAYLFSPLIEFEPYPLIDININ